MFKLLPSGLPKDPHFEPDLEKLGFFINEDDEIRRIDNPRAYYNFFVSKDDRTNSLQREALHLCLHGIIQGRLEAIGVEKIRLPLGADQNEPHVPIYVSEDLAKKSRVVVLFYESTEDLAVLSYRILLKKGGINAGSAIDLVKYIQSQPSSPDDPSAPGIILANMGQLVYYRRGHRAVTWRSWGGLPQKNAVSGPLRTDPGKNFVPGHGDPAQHLRSVFKDVISGMCAKDCKIDIIAISLSANEITRFFNEKEHWNTWGGRLNSLSLLSPYYVVNSEFDNVDFLEWLEKRGRAYALYPCDTFMPLAGPLGSKYCDAYGCNTYTLGEEYHQELLLPVHYKKVVDWIQEVAMDPTYENEDLGIEVRPLVNETLATPPESDDDNEGAGGHDSGADGNGDNAHFDLSRSGDNADDQPGNADQQDNTTSAETDNTTAQDASAPQQGDATGQVGNVEPETREITGQADTGAGDQAIGIHDTSIFVQRVPVDPRTRNRHDALVRLDAERRRVEEDSRRSAMAASEIGSEYELNYHPGYHEETESNQPDPISEPPTLPVEPIQTEPTAVIDPHAIDEATRAEYEPFYEPGYYEDTQSNQPEPASPSVDSNQQGYEADSESNQPEPASPSHELDEGEDIEPVADSELIQALSTVPTAVSSESGDAQPVRAESPEFRPESPAFTDNTPLLSRPGPFPPFESDSDSDDSDLDPVQAVGAAPAVPPAGPNGHRAVTVAEMASDSDESDVSDFVPVHAAGATPAAQPAGPNGTHQPNVADMASDSDESDSTLEDYYVAPLPLPATNGVHNDHPLPPLPQDDGPADGGRPTQIQDHPSVNTVHEETTLNYVDSMMANLQYSYSASNGNGAHRAGPPQYDGGGDYFPQDHGPHNLRRHAAFLHSMRLDVVSPPNDGTAAVSTPTPDPGTSSDEAEDSSASAAKAMDGSSAAEEVSLQLATAFKRPFDFKTILNNPASETTSDSEAYRPSSWTCGLIPKDTLRKALCSRTLPPAPSSHDDQGTRARRVIVPRYPALTDAQESRVERAENRLLLAMFRRPTKELMENLQRTKTHTPAGLQRLPAEQGNYLEDKAHHRLEYHEVFARQAIPTYNLAGEWAKYKAHANVLDASKEALVKCRDHILRLAKALLSAEEVHYRADFFAAIRSTTQNADPAVYTQAFLALMRKCVEVVEDAEHYHHARERWNAYTSPDGDWMKQYADYHLECLKSGNMLLGTKFDSPGMLMGLHFVENSYTWNSQLDLLVVAAETTTGWWEGVQEMVREDYYLINDTASRMAEFHMNFLEQFQQVSVLVEREQALALPVSLNRGPDGIRFNFTEEDRLEEETSHSPYPHDHAAFTEESRFLHQPLDLD